MYVVMLGNVFILCEILYVVFKYRFSVDLRNKKGFLVYLLVVKMVNGECVKIFKIEVNVLDCVWDMEFFLSDKEWVKKMKRNLDKEKIEKKVQKMEE